MGMTDYAVSTAYCCEVCICKPSQALSRIRNSALRLDETKKCLHEELFSGYCFLSRQDKVREYGQLSARRSGDGDEIYD